MKGPLPSPADSAAWDLQEHQPSVAGFWGGSQGLGLGQAPEGRARALRAFSTMTSPQMTQSRAPSLPHGNLTVLSKVSICQCSSTPKSLEQCLQQCGYSVNANRVVTRTSHSPHSGCQGTRLGWAELAEAPVCAPPPYPQCPI